MSATVVLVTAVGAATGSESAAAALACSASEPDRAALLVDLGDRRPPRPALVATSAARALEERLAAHMPEAAAASRGRICRLRLPASPEGVERVAAALPLVRESAAVVQLPPWLLRPALEDARLRATAVLLRADLPEDRALTALAVRDLIDRGLRVAVLKRPLGRLPAEAASWGMPIAGDALPVRLRDRLLGPSEALSQRCYSRQHDAEAEPTRTTQPQRRDHEGPGRGRGLHRHPQRGPGR